MKQEKEKLLQQYINELKTIRKELVESPKKKFLTSVTYNCTLNSGRVIPREQLLKNGKDGSAVIVVPIIKDTNEVLVNIEPRVFTKLTVDLSFPSGYIEKEEDAIIAAKRELLEETGYEAEKMEFLDSYYQDVGASAALNYAFIATGCKKVSEQKLDETEIVKYMSFTYDELKELESRNLIAGASSKLVLSKINKYFKGE